jgi:hypothetical protein
MVAMALDDGRRMALQQLTNEACEDIRREATQHPAKLVGHDWLCIRGGASSDTDQVGCTLCDRIDGCCGVV